MEGFEFSIFGPKVLLFVALILHAVVRDAGSLPESHRLRFRWFTPGFFGFLRPRSFVAQLFLGRRCLIAFYGCSSQASHLPNKSEKVSFSFSAVSPSTCRVDFLCTCVNSVQDDGGERC